MNAAASSLVGGTPSPPGVSPNIDEVPSARTATLPVSTRPSPAGNAAKPDTDLEHEALVRTEVDALVEQLERHRRWFVLTGAGCSTESGIPAYRDANGAWQHGTPIVLQDFVRSDAVRQRYWARSCLGFGRVNHALPNRAHQALVRFQRLGLQRALVTQNVDGLHQKAGSQGVIDLHGQLSMVGCLSCQARVERAALQTRLLDLNPWLSDLHSMTATPDGDAELEADAYRGLRVPACSSCGGILKPAVVFFGETVPAERVALAYQALGESDAVLVVGSSLMVFSGYRFVCKAWKSGQPIVVVNAGVTRADPLAQLKLEGSCARLLDSAITRLEG